jgi:hypothetical protein
MPDGSGVGVSWRDYVDGQINALHRLYDSRFKAMEQAVDKAEQQLRARLEGMNEFREALKDQASRLATRESLDMNRDQLIAMVEALSKRVAELEKDRANATGRSWMLWALLGTGLTVLSIALRFLIP